jgi:hypothetical protein
MKTAKEKKEVLIEHKVISKDDILSLIRLLHTQADKILQKSKDQKRADLIMNGWNISDIKDMDIDTSRSRLEFTATDHTKFTGTFEQIAEIDKYLGTSRVIEINIYFSERVLDTLILLRIKHSDTVPTYLLVEGHDQLWVAETLRQTENFFSKCADQTIYFKKYGILIVLLTILILNFFLNNTIEIIARRMHIFPKYAMQTLTADWRFYVILLSMITISPALLLYGWLRRLWPRIELQTGSDFSQIERNKNNKLRLIIITLLVPAIITYLMTLL